MNVLSIYAPMATTIRANVDGMAVAGPRVYPPFPSVSR